MAAVLSILPRRRGRQAPAAPQPRDLLKFFPLDYKGRTFIYALGFKGDVVKVGLTKSPRKRLQQHWDSVNGEVEWLHVFDSMHFDTARAVERAAPAALQGIAEQINGSEWFFASAPKAEIIALIRPLIVKAKAEVWARWEAEEARKRRIDALYQILEEAGAFKKLGL